MKARIPDLSSTDKSTDGRLHLLATTLKELKDIPEFAIHCSAETQRLMGDVTISAVSEYLNKLSDSADGKDIAHCLCKAFHAYITLIAQLNKASDKEKYTKEICDGLKHALELSTKLTLKSYFTNTLYEPLLVFIKDTGLSIFLVQIGMDFGWTMDMGEILYSLMYMCVLPKEYNMYVIGMIELMFDDFDTIAYLEENKYYSTGILMKGLTPRKYSVNGGVLMPMERSKYPFLNDKMVYDLVTARFINCSKKEQVSFCYPNTEQMSSRKISELQKYLIQKDYEMNFQLCEFVYNMSTDFSYMQTKVIYEQKKADMNRQLAEMEKEARNKYRQKSAAPAKQEVVYVDRTVVDTSETDMLKSKLAKYKTRIETLESTVRGLERSQLEYTKLQKENKMLQEYIEAEELPETETEELSEEDIQILSKMKAHLVVPDIHSLKQLRSILVNSTIVYVAKDTMFKQELPSSYEVYLFCIGMCSHKSYYKWRNQVEDKNYTLCMTAGIKKILRCLLDAYKQEA